MLLTGLGYKHKAVHHSQKYVSADGVHVNHTEICSEALKES